MTVQIEGWNVIDQDAAILWREYAFTKGAYATTFVFRGADGLVVVSPGTQLEARELDALAEFGKVRALVANNTLHHMGQRAWLERFPEATSYCPPGAVATLEKKVSGVPYRPLSDLALPSHVRWEDAPGFKTGESILRIDAKPGPVWYAGDLLANMQQAPRPPLKWLFSLTDSGPGFRLFKLATWLIVKDKKAVREWMLTRLEQQPPAVVVPCAWARVRSERRRGASEGADSKAVPALAAPLVAARRLLVQRSKKPFQSTRKAALSLADSAG